MEMSDVDQVIAEIPQTVKLPFLGLRKFGFFTTSKVKAYISMSILVLLQVNLVVIAMLQFINIKKDISDIVRNMEAIFAFSLLLLRMIIVTYRSEGLTKLIQTTKLFWDSNKCNQQTEREIISIRRFIFQLQRLLLLAVLLGVSLVMIYPLWQKIMPTGIWTMEGHEKLYNFVIIVEYIVIPCCGIFVWCLDCMYLGFCAEVVIQFRMLSQYLEEVGVDGSADNQTEIDRLDKIKGWVRHHRLILQFVKEFQQAFSLVLLLEFVIDGPLICAELLA
ncbi:hypothetical protein ILUMI_10632, partial [Ignelater luminosus]